MKPYKPLKHANKEKQQIKLSTQKPSKSNILNSSKNKPKSKAQAKTSIKHIKRRLKKGKVNKMHSTD